MLKSALLIVLCLFLFGVNGYAQSDYQDEKLMVSSEVLKHEDPSNDLFYELYGFTLKNLTNENIKFELVVNYTHSGAVKNTKSGDIERIFSLAPGESISGQSVQNEKLTLFKAFLPGNSGRKASEGTTKISSFEVNYF